MDENVRKKDYFVVFLILILSAPYIKRKLFMKKIEEKIWYVALFSYLCTMKHIEEYALFRYLLSELCLFGAPESAYRFSFFSFRRPMERGVCKQLSVRRTLTLSGEFSVEQPVRSTVLLAGELCAAAGDNMLQNIVAVGNHHHRLRDCNTQAHPVISLDSFASGEDQTNQLPSKLIQ
jgi:hypothetical protein